MYKEEGSPNRRIVSLRESLANLACKLRHLAVPVWAWLSSWSCGHIVAWCDMVLLYWAWQHCRHGSGLPAILCNVVSVVVFINAF